MSVSLRTMPESEREQREAEIAGKWADASPRLGERARRIWLGAGARQLGHGGIKFAAQATGAAIETVRSGIADLGKDPGELEEGRVRRPGGGRMKAEDKDPGLPAALDALLGGDDSEAGDPMTPRLRWTSKSLVNLSDELRDQGHESSPTMVRRLMYQAGWRLQSDNKSVEKSPPHPDRNAQFGYISRNAAGFAGAGQPVISADAKKKELAGNFASGGREWAGAAGPGPRLPRLGRGQGHPLRHLRPGRERGIRQRRRRPRHPRVRRRLPGVMVGHPRPPPVPGRDAAAGHRRFRRVQRRPVPRVREAPGRLRRAPSPGCDRSPLPLGNLKVEQGRAQAVLLRLRQLARQAPDQLRDRP